MRSFRDATGTICLQVDAGTASLTLKPAWRDVVAPGELSGIITALVKEARHEDNHETPAALEPPRRSTERSETELAARWELWHEIRRLRRLRSEQPVVRTNSPREECDNQYHVGVTYADGVVERVWVSPAWAEHASLQDLSSRISGVLGRRPLAQPQTHPLQARIDTLRSELNN